MKQTLSLMGLSFLIASSGIALASHHTMEKFQALQAQRLEKASQVAALLR